MSIGQIVQVIGAVVDIEFPRDAMPKIYEALVLKNDDANSLAEQGLVFEVEQQLGDGVVRTIAMGSSEGLRRGMSVESTGRNLGAGWSEDPRPHHGRSWPPDRRLRCDRGRGNPSDSQ